jgi:hypothetical protein
MRNIEGARFSRIATLPVSGGGGPYYRSICRGAEAKTSPVDPTCSLPHQAGSNLIRTGAGTDPNGEPAPNLA